MVLVDTSVWINLYRKENAILGQRMWSLVAENLAALCGQVWVEYLGGFRKEEERKVNEMALLEFPFLETSQQAYQRAAHLLGRYPRLGAGDAIIAATSLETNSPLFTLDKNFYPLAAEGLKLF